jgi:predicted transcriptional regulator of viral defense system
MPPVRQTAQPALSCTSRKELHVARFVAHRQRLITAEELREAGISAWTTTRWVKRGRLRREHRGVYVYGGGELSQEGKFVAALLAIGDDSLLSHIPAAVLQAFWPYGIPSVVDVTVPRQLRSRRGIRVHSVSELPPSAVTTVGGGIPVTTPARTVVDLAGTLRSDRAFRRMVHEAQVQEKLTFAELAVEVERTPANVKGRARLMIELTAGPTRTRSSLEEWGVDFLRARNFPQFTTNARLAGLPFWVEVDVFFPDYGLVIELDGDKYHDTPWRREHDAYKRQLITDHEYPLLVLTDEDAAPGREEQTAGKIHNALRRCR